MTLPPSRAALRPTAGALRLVEPGSPRPSSIDVAAYAEAMTALCPYLAPSLARGLTTWTVYEVVSDDARVVEAELFHAGVQAAEWLRPLLSRPGGLLRCENIVVLGDAPAATTARELLARPHWALKHLYARTGIMFGKFCAGVEELSRAGTRIPPAPVSFLPVRAAIRRRDPGFLRAGTPDLASALASGEDDGRDVFAAIGTDDWETVRAWATTLIPPRKPSPVSRTGSAGPSRRDS